MAVPTSGKYAMFGTSSSEPIAGAISSSEGNVSGVDDFGNLINVSNLNYFDPRYAGDLNSLDDVDSSLQYRNYPTIPAPESCPEFSFTEVTTPGEVTLTFEIYSIDGNSTGVLNYGSTYNTTLTYNLTIGDSITITALNLSTGTIFAGWSNYQGTEGVFQTNTALTATATNTATYYAVIQQGSYTSQDYCYTTSDNLNDICLVCNNPTTVFFDKTDFISGGIEGATLYTDANLNTTVPNGYYYLSGSVNPIIYNVTSGTAVEYGVCEGDLIYCS